MSIEHLRFAPEILRRLGEELIPHPDLGVVELVRNSYDADSTACTVQLLQVDQPGGSVIVSDVGDGMALNEIRDGFLLVGRSGKIDDTYTPSGRRKVGEKGLGRIAALRLGRQVKISTRPRAELGTEHILTINWNRFENAIAVEEIELEVTTASTSDDPGTTIQILDLRQALKSTDVQRLARALVMLTGPFPGADDSFHITLDAPEFSEMEQIVRAGFYQACSYYLTASLDKDGQVRAELADRRGAIIATGDHHEVTSSGRREAHSGFLAPPAKFELWMFNRSQPSFDTQITPDMRKAFTAWLDEVGGVHFYQRGLRVHPYGDRGFDWLEMNVLRGRNPEERPGTNNSVGCLLVNDDEGHLIPKTDRSGFVENSAFSEIKSFARAALEWAAEVRLERRDLNRQVAKKKTDERVKETSKEVDLAIKLVPSAIRPVIEKAVKENQEALEKKLQVAENDLMLYRTLSTVGTTTAVFAHETLRPVDTIEQLIATIARRASKEMGARYEPLISEPAGLIERAAASLRTFAELPLELLKQRKRRVRIVDINTVIVDILSTFSPYLIEAQVDVRSELSDDKVTTRVTIAAIEAILANFLANSVAAFIGNHSPERPRQIVVRSSVDIKHATFSVLDSGPGITALSIDDIWKPGRSTRYEGTGMGLTIVRDIVADLRGHASAVPNGELGGAEFHIRLPYAAEV